MDKQGREYQYQADWSIGNRMFHVRCDDWDSFKNSVDLMETLIPSNKPFPDDTGKSAVTKEQAVNAPECGIHKTPMKWHVGGVSKTSGRPYPGFWSCPERMEDGGYCTFKYSSRVTEK